MIQAPPLTGLSAAQAQRIQREAEENDAIYASRGASPPDISSIHYGHERMLDWALTELGPDLAERRILDVGIGDGCSSVLLAQRGATVTGIEISRVAIERAQELARRYQVGVDFQLMAGENLEFPDETFDRILCMSVLHHLDLQRASREFARVLRPGGKAVLIDPLASNPPGWVYRKFIQSGWRSATSNETPLRLRDLSALRQCFDSVRWRGMFLLTLLPIAADRILPEGATFARRGTKALFEVLFPADEALARLPMLGRFAWKICVVAVKRGS